MAEARLQILIDLEENVSKAMDGVGASIDGVSAKAKNMEPVFKKMAQVGTAGFLAIAAEVGVAINAFAESQKQLQVVDSIIGTLGAKTLKTMGGSLEDAQKQVREFGASMQAMGGIADEAAAEGVAKLTQVTGNYQRAQEAAKIAADLSIFKHIEYADAVMVVSKVLAGNTGILARYGIEIDKNATAEQALAAIAKMTAGQYAAYGKTIAGQTKIMSESIGDLQENIGQAFLPALTKVLEVMLPIIQAMGKWAAEHPKLVAGIAAVAAGLFALLAIVGTLGMAIGGLTTVAAAFGVTVAVLLGWVGLIIAIIVAVIAIGVLLYKNWDVIKAKAIEIWGAIKAFFSLLWQTMGDEVRAAWEAIRNFFTGIWASITGAAMAAWSAFTGVLQAIWGGIKTFFSATWDAIKAVFQFAVAFLAGLVILAFQAMGIDIVQVFMDIKNFFTTTWAEIQLQFSAAMELIKLAWTEMWGAIRDFVSQVWAEIVAVFTSSTAAVSSIWTTGWAAIKNFLLPILTSIKTVVTEAWAWLKSSFNAIVEPIRSVWQSLWSSLGAIVTSVWEGIKNVVKESINFVIDKINSLIAAANSVASKGGSAIGIKAPQIPLIPRLAEGGVVTRPTLALIGEAGPEAVIPLNRAGLRMAGAGAGGVTINLTLTGNTFMGEDDLVEKVSKTLMRALKDNVRI
ncbi:MAG TPA: phage tail tape measure protein [Alphaproteobacteria bacterium]|jgi:hypothetical protein